MNASGKNKKLPAAAVQDHRRTYLDFFYVYPVISRRSRGLSIGINLNPDKICNFDCIYCEVDRITPPIIKTVDINILKGELTKTIEIIKSGDLSKEWRFQNVDISQIKDIAFSGDGEPTMVDNFSAYIKTVSDVRKEQGLNSTKIVLITNATGLDKSDVRKGLKILDENNGEIWGKLDAGTDSYYKLVNRSNVKFERILKNLLLTAQERPIVIQSLFLKVHSNIMPEDELRAYCERLKELVKSGAKIKEVHAYTVARPTPLPYATKLNPDELNLIAEKIRKNTGITVYEFP